MGRDLHQPRQWRCASAVLRQEAFGPGWYHGVRWRPEGWCWHRAWTLGSADQVGTRTYQGHPACPAPKHAERGHAGWFPTAAVAPVGAGCIRLCYQSWDGLADGTAVPCTQRPGCEPAAGAAGGKESTRSRRGAWRVQRQTARSRGFPSEGARTPAPELDSRRVAIHAWRHDRWTPRPCRRMDGVPPGASGGAGASWRGVDCLPQARWAPSTH
jgi:hypothetical protein